MSVMDTFLDIQDSRLSTERDKRVESLKEEIISLFSDERVLDPIILEHIKKLPNDFFVQISYMGTTSEYGPRVTNSHLAYELGMMKLVVEHADQIRDMIFPYSEQEGILEQSEHTPGILTRINKDNCISTILFCILCSDIGKMGYEQFNEESVSSSFARIYNKAIFFQPHHHWMIHKATQTNPYLNPDQTQHVRTLLRENEASIINNLPIEIALRIGAAVAYESVYLELQQKGWTEAHIIDLFQKSFVPLPAISTPTSKPLFDFFGATVSMDEAKKQLENITLTFTLNPEEQNLFSDTGFDPESATMGTFWTRSHLVFGKHYLENVVPSELLPLIDIAMSHHLSQGELLSSMAEMLNQLTRERSSQNVLEVILRIIAFTEILDKLDAVANRGRKLPLSLVKKFINEKVMENVKNFYPNDRDLARIFNDMLDDMTQTKSLNLSSLVIDS